MSEISVIGLDLAKNVFQVHCLDADERIVLKRKLRRYEVEVFFKKLPPCLVGMEACGGAHHWARLLRSHGHDVRLLPPSYVKAYVRRGKTDAADAAAIAEAVTRPSMRFVGIKEAEQQGVLVKHSVRDLLIRQKTMLINALRGHLSEFGLVSAQGRGGLQQLRSLLSDAPANLPASALKALQGIERMIETLLEEISGFEKQLRDECRRSEKCRRLMSIPGIGPICAGYIASNAPDLSQFSTGRDFAAWAGLTPKAHSSGGKDRVGKISKQGDMTLRRLLVTGATTIVLLAGRGKARRKGALMDWISRLLEKGKPFKMVAVALANKMARIIWALMTQNTFYTASADNEPLSSLQES